MHEITTVSAKQEIIERLKSRLWRRSHSLNTVKTYKSAVKKFEKYLANKSLTYEDVVKAPIEYLDDFAAWLDADLAATTTNEYVCYVKRLLKNMGAIINEDHFKENVTLPKARVFMDDKVNEEQIRRIILASTNQRLKTVLMLMKDTPARPVEILGLKLGDFNLSYDPPFVTIPPYLAKNDIPREVFFTQETKTLLTSYIESEGIKSANQFIFLHSVVDELNEELFQKRLHELEHNIGIAFRTLLSSPEFKDLNEEVRQKGSAKRYKIHPYSFKKFSFTRTADILGELPARAIKGDSAYVLTYYKKSREERAEDYRKLTPKVSIFTMDEKSKIRKQVEETVKDMKDKDLAGLLEFMRTAKGLPESGPSG